MQDKFINQERRQLLRYGFYGLGLLASGPLVFGCQPFSNNTCFQNVGPLGEPDNNDLCLPAGYQSRVIARSGQTVAKTNYRWHPAPDGGAAFPQANGGWIYVSNSEIDEEGGGVSAVRFDAVGNISAAYPILTGTNRNCAGGPAPWGAWLSCEEVTRGRVWECDPMGQSPAVMHPALGVFKHEAVAVDPVGGQLYLTEDEEDGGFYRFTPARWQGARPDLSAGLLEVAQLIRADNSSNGTVYWHKVPDPQFTGDIPTRFQVVESTPFAGGEGSWHYQGKVYFTTKHDNTVWLYDIAAQQMTPIYRGGRYDNPVLTGVDNVTVSNDGGVFVAEDGGNMQIVKLQADGTPVPLLRVIGHVWSEVTGPAFSPDGRRLYFSSQRGNTGESEDGVTYEVRFTA